MNGLNKMNGTMEGTKERNYTAQTKEEKYIKNKNRCRDP